MTSLLISFALAIIPLQTSEQAPPPSTVPPATLQPTTLQPATLQPATLSPSVTRQTPAPQQVEDPARPGMLTPIETGETAATPPAVITQSSGPVTMQLSEQSLTGQSAEQSLSEQAASANLLPAADNRNQNQPDTLVICPPDFLEALQPWLRYRQAQGYRISLHRPPGSSYEIKQLVLRVAAGGALKNIVLIGDSGQEGANGARVVPTDYVKAEVNVEFGSEPEIATDNTYADIDGDGSPDVTIGRLPVDTPEELSALIERIRRYEDPSSAGEWQRRVNFVAGVGGFGEMIDRLIEQTTRQIVTDLIPPEFDTSMTYGSWTSPYCPDPRRFSETAIGRFNEGCMFWVYIGHGSRERLDKIYMPDQSHRILDSETVSQLSCEAGSPIAIFLACYTGATDGPQDCLAEQMLRQDKGPIAVIAGTRVTMPYAMSLLSLEMLREYFDGQAETLGELLLVGKQRLVAGGEEEDPYRNLIDGMGKAMSPLPELLEKERLEHVHLIHLLGDPLLRLRRSQAMPIAVTETATAGDMVEVTGQMPADGVLRLDISYRRDRFRHRPPRRNEYDSSDKSFQGYQTAYNEAHELVCFEEDLTAPEGSFTRQIRLPEDASGECHIRAMLITDEEAVMGSAPIKIKSLPRGARTVEEPADNGG